MSLAEARLRLELLFRRTIRVCHEARVTPKRAAAMAVVALLLIVTGLHQTGQHDTVSFGNVYIRGTGAPEKTPPTDDNNIQPPSGAKPLDFVHGARKDPTVCIVGVARTIETAYATSKVWSRFHAFWVVEETSELEVKMRLEELGLRQPSDDVADVVDGRTPAFHAVRPDVTDVFPTWGGSVKHALKYIQAKGFVCDYHFLMHDEVTWSLNDAFAPDTAATNSNSSIDTGTKVANGFTDELHDVLARYKPAVVGFPWAYADKQFGGARGCAAAWNRQRVAPLTSIETTVGVYHASVTDWLLPFPPAASGNTNDDANTHNGDGGGFANTPTVSLSAVWANVFLPFMFKSQALRLNTIHYAGQRPGGRDTRRRVPIPQDALDSKSHMEYIRYLDGGLRASAWGPHLMPGDVSWRPEEHSGNNNNNNNNVAGPPYTPADAVARLQDMFDVDHPAIAGVVKAWNSVFVPKFKIFVFTYNRIKSLTRLLASLQTAVYPPEYTVSLQVFCDYSPETQADMRALLSKYSWTHGPFTVTFATKHTGLRSTILNAWAPSDPREFGVFLEDDIEVSPYFMVYSKSCVLEYGRWQASETPQTYHVLGCSLYRPIYSQTTNDWSFVDSGGQPFLMQDVSSWGAVFFPRRWKDFLDWYAARSHINPLIPNSITNTWPVAASWKKFLIRMCSEAGMGMLFPNLPRNMTLTTNHLEPGTNDKGTGASALAAKQRFTLPLMAYSDTAADHGSGEFVMSGLLAPKWDDLAVFDIHRKKLEGPSDLQHDFRWFDRATAVVYATAVSQQLNVTLAHYARMNWTFAEVVLVWNSDVELNISDLVNPAALPPHAVPIRLVASGGLGFGSPGNPNFRYLPVPGRSTWCVFLVDVGVRLSEQSVKDGFRTWQQYMDSPVGYVHSLRTLPPTAARTPVAPAAGAGKNGKAVAAAAVELDLGSPPPNARAVVPTHCPKAFKPPHNLLLPDAMFVHGKYLHAYTYAFDIPGMDAMRAAVEKAFSGAELSFSVVVGLVSKQPPVVIDESSEGNVIPGYAPSLQAEGGSLAGLNALERAQRSKSLNGMLKPAMGIQWKGGEPRDVPC